MLPPPGLGPLAAPAPAFAFAQLARDVLVSSTALLSPVATDLPSLHRPLPIPNHPDPDNTNPDVITVTMTPSSTTTSSVVPTATGSPGDAKPTECRLLGSFAILVQLALGALALLALVYKRWRERPQRPVKIWFFDVSKQVVGSVLVHAANVFMSMLTSGRFSIKVMPSVVVGRAVAAGMGLVGRGEEYVPNPCSFYLLNLGIDTTLGIPVLIIIVRVTTKLMTYTPLGNPPESIQSGNYGHPPRVWWWLKQSFIYFCGLMGMKLCVLILFMALPWLSRVGDWALGWTEGNEKLQIVFVMMLFPLIMNAMQYYIIDSYIKKQDGAGAHGADHLSDDARVDDAVVYAELSASENDEESEDEADEDEGKHVRAEHLHLARRETYDPAVDGDSQTVIGSSSSRDSNRRGLLPKELIPPE